MEVSTAITLLTINLIVLSAVIILMIIGIIIVIIKINKIAKNVQDTTSHIASITEWFSPMKVFGEIAKVVTSFKKR